MIEQLRNLFGAKNIFLDRANEVLNLLGKRALVTGSSRGIGRAIAIELARRGAIPIIHGHNKAKKAKETAEAVQNLGMMHGDPAPFFLADITDHTQRENLLRKILQTNILGSLDIIILNAAGGLEQGKDADYPWRINVDAQTNLVHQALNLGLFTNGGIIVYVTSHVAHLYRPGFQMCSSKTKINDFLRMYHPVAKSKHEGELALRAIIPDLENHGIKLFFLTGPLVNGTPAVELYLKPEGQLALAQKVFGLTTPEKMARQLVDHLENSHLMSGHTIIVDRLALIKTATSIRYL